MVSLQFEDITPKMSCPHGQCDVVFLFGDGSWDGLKAHRLFDDRLTAVCAPELEPEGQANLSSPERLPLIQCSAHPNAWNQFFRILQQQTAGSHRGTRLSTWRACLDAALHGYAIALLPHYMAAAALREGALKEPWPQGLPAKNACYLTYAEHRAGEPAAQKLVDWFMAHPWPGAATTRH